MEKQINGTPVSRILSGLRTMHNACYKTMAISRKRYHVYKLGVGAGVRFSIFREDAELPIPHEIVLSDVQSMTATTMTNRMTDVLAKEVV